jgi:hypothetical protein
MGKKMVINILLDKYEIALSAFDSIKRDKNALGDTFENFILKIERF